MLEVCDFLLFFSKGNFNVTERVDIFIVGFSQLVECMDKEFAGGYYL
jgi:hypothetical protein